jgi:hypothetical protein
MSCVPMGLAMYVFWLGRAFGKGAGDVCCSNSVCPPKGGFTVVYSTGDLLRHSCIVQVEDCVFPISTGSV